MNMLQTSRRSFGQGLVEFMLILPVMLFLIMGIMDFGRAMIVYAQGSNAVRDSVRFAQVWGSEGDHPYLDCDTIRGIAETVMFADVNVTVRYEKENGTPVNCGANDADLASGDILIVESTGTFRLMTPFLANAFPSLAFNFRAQRTIVKDLLLEGDTGEGSGTPTCPNGTAAQPSICVDDITVNEEDGIATFQISVRPTNHTGSVTVNFATYDGSAFAGQHYTSSSGSVTFAANEHAKFVTVGLIDNDTVLRDASGNNVNRQFYLVLSGASGGTIVRGRAIATIIDNDTTPEAAVDNTYRAKISRVNVGSGNTIQNTLQLHNLGTGALDLSRVSVRYWFNADGGSTWNIHNCPNGASCSVQTPSTPLEGGNRYFLINFNSGAGTLAVGAIRTGMLFQLNNGNGSFNQSNHWSNSPAASSHPYVDAPRITVYYDSTLIGGTEPGPVGSSSWPNVSVSSSRLTVEEGESFTFNVQLSAAASQVVTVNYQFIGTSTFGSDYTTPGWSSPLTFNVGETSKSIQVNVTDDTSYEQNETITIRLTSVANGNLGTNRLATTTILANDVQPTVNVRSSTASVNEGGVVDFIVEISPAPSQQVSVNYAIGGTATIGSDYSVSGPGSPLVFAAGDTSKTILISTIDDTQPESDETVTITLSNAVNVTLGTSTATTTILANDLPTVSVRGAAPIVNEGDSTSFIIEVSPASPLPVTVSYSFSGTAQSPGDYTASGLSSPVTFAANETSKIINISTINDTTPEDDENIVLTLSSSVNAILGTATATITIPANDPELSVSLLPNSAEEGQTATFTVSLSAPSATPVTVNYALTGTAAFGSDYTNTELTTANGMITFGVNEQSKNYIFTIEDDPTPEQAETVIFTISNPSSNAVLSSTTSQTLTILANDMPLVTIDDVSVPENVGTANLTVRISPTINQPVTIQYSTANNTAVAGSDYTAVSNASVTILANQTTATIPITIINDVTDEPVETFYVNLGAVTTNNASVTRSQAAVTILEDSSDQPNISINDVTVTEGTGVNAVFTVTLSKVSGRNLSIPYTTVNGTAQGGASSSDTTKDYVTTLGTLTINAGSLSGTISVPIINNTTYVATSRTFFVNIGDGNGLVANAVVTDAQGLGTILEDDPAPQTGTLRISVWHDTWNTTTNLVPRIRIINSGTTAVPMSELTIRYYFKDAGPSTPTLQCDNPWYICGSRTVLWGTTVGGSRYVELSFGSGAGNIAANTSTERIDLAITGLNNNSNKADDYSFFPGYNEAEQISNRIVIFRRINGVNEIVWGIPPA